MSNLRRLITLAASLAAAGWFMPLASHAFTAELVSITPEATDISDQMERGDAPDTIQLFGWLTEEDVEYTAVFSVDEEPAVAVTPGGDVSLDNRPVYDADAGTYTITFTATGFIEGIDKDMPEGMVVSVMGLVGAVPLGEDGPPEQMRGAWFSTNLEEWELIPPSEGNVAFGFKLTGPTGSTGFFRMFMPQGIIDLLSEFSGKELTIEELAVFNGDEQASLAISEVEGGAYIDINVTFTEGLSTVTEPEAEGSVTKEIVVSEQLAISLAASKDTVKAGQEVRLYGWLKNGKANQDVTLWRKQKGEDNYVRWNKTLKTKKDGYFVVRFTARKTADYKVTYRSGGKKMTSEERTITVK